MADGMDEAATAFTVQVAPGAQLKDQRGAVIETGGVPEPMFAERQLEGDPATGDTDDGGDDPRLAAREREIADGHEGRERIRSSNAKSIQSTPGDEGHVDDSGEETLSDLLAEGESLDEKDDDEAGPRYEVTIGGQSHQVSLKEALRGYIRNADAHQRYTALSQMQGEIDNEYQRQQSNWRFLLKAKADYEEDLRNLIPTEPNWDQAFAINPQAAHDQQKIYQTLYGKLAQSQQQRAEIENYRSQEEARRVQKYAYDGFNKFVMDNVKSLPDEPTLKKNLLSMRKTAADAGFSEYELSTVYDPRMLTVLLWASKYRRMMTAQMKLRAVQPGKGKTLQPGAATPFGTVRRGGFDEAQRRLASTGKLTDAVEVFRRIL